MHTVELRVAYAVDRAHFAGPKQRVDVLAARALDRVARLRVDERHRARRLGRDGLR
jgi:hypothetical protein